LCQNTGATILVHLPIELPNGIAETPNGIRFAKSFCQIELPNALNEFARLAIRFGNSIWQFDLAIRFGNSIWQFDLATRFGNSIWQQLDMAIRFGSSLWQFDLATRYGN
jgi:hypothetical protein